MLSTLGEDDVVGHEARNPVLNPQHNSRAMTQYVVSRNEKIQKGKVLRCLHTNRALDSDLRFMRKLEDDEIQDLHSSCGTLPGIPDF